MYADKIKLVRETYYRQAILFALVLMVIVIIAFFTCIEHENGVNEFITMFTTINVVSLLAYICLMLAVVYFLRYKYYIKKREDFLNKGTIYSGEIIRTFAVKNWFGQGRARNYKMVISYDGKEFETPPYDFDMEYTISSSACNVYVLKGECYAADFSVEKKRKGQDDASRQARVKEEDYLYCNINSDNFDRKKFIEGRVTIVLDKSDKYIMPIPRPAVFSDGVVKSVVIDIAIEAPKKVALFPNFEDELTEYINSVAAKMPSEQLAEFNELLKEKIYELLRSYYYFVKIKNVDVGEI